VSAEAITTTPDCSRCAKPLTLEEMHYLCNGDGTAQCQECEGQWMADVAAWRRGEREDFPQR
jgi:hypothetical protein